MDQKRLFLAIAISIAILLGFQLLVRPQLPHPVPQEVAGTTTAKPEPGKPGTAAVPGGGAATVVPKEVPRLKIAGPGVTGSISLLGARIDDIVLNGYRETLATDSPLVRLLEPRSDPQPYYVQYGWSAAPGTNVTLPDGDTVWSASGDLLAPGKPVTLSWNNGAGVTFEIALTIDDNYMFSARQNVRNATATPVSLFPWSRIRRDYKPELSGYSVLFEGMLGVFGGTLQETSYDDAKS